MSKKASTKTAGEAPAKASPTDAAGDSLKVEPCPREQTAWFEQQVEQRHYLGSARAVGDYLRQIVRSASGEVVALLAWGPACYALKDRDEWIGWSAVHRGERLKLIVQNRRYLLLFERGGAPNLASKALAAALRALPGQWEQAHGYRPLLAESFTDAQRGYEGTCYKAANWEAAGMSKGHARHRADYYIPNQSPKKLWLYKLHPDAKKHLCAPVLPGTSARGQTRAAQGTLPVSTQQTHTLGEAFARAPDPRGKNTRFKIRPVLTLIAMALLAGRRDIAQIARYAQSLKQAQRREMGLPLRKGAKRFWETPTYQVFYQVLRDMDPEAFADILNQWLKANAETLPESLALDGKMIRNVVGTCTLARHEDGAPVAMSVHDRKEGTRRCEQTSAARLLESTGPLDGKLITADALHCQKTTARAIAAKGGEYLLQIKPNQPSLQALAERKAQASARTPFLRQ